MQAKSESSAFGRRHYTWRLAGILTAAVAALAAARPAFADDIDHHGVGTAVLDSDVLLWGGASLGGVVLVLAFSRLILARRLAHSSTGPEDHVGYVTAVRQFSRNARLFLAYSLLAELGTGIWAVMLNLYLLRVGFPVIFVGTFWMVNMLCHGAGALPAGVIADRFGRRRAFVLATLISLTAQGMLLFAAEPAVILILAGVAGFGEAFHGVTGAPFMMENSEAQERPHLFSLNACLLQVSRFAGNLSGGLLPLAWAAVLGVPALEPAAARWALVTGLPLTAMSLVPLAFMHEKPVESAPSLKDFVTFRHVVHVGIITRFTLLGLMVGTAFGLTVRFFNVFFQEGHNASDSQVGTILAMGAMAAGGSILLSPVLAQQWGKVRSLLFTQTLSLPFLLLMGVLPWLPAVTALYVMRGALYSIGLPLRNQLQMEFVAAKERGTTAGFTHTAFDLGGGIGAGLAGLLIGTSGFIETFAVAAILILIPAVLYFVWFDALEMRTHPRTAQRPLAVGGRGH